MLKIFKNKIIAFYSLAVLFSFVFSAWLIDRHFEKEMLDSFKRELSKETFLAKSVVETCGENGGGSAKLKKAAGDFYAGLGTRFTFISSDGRVLADSLGEPSEMENHLDRPEIKAALENSPVFSVRESETLKMEMLYFALPAYSGAGPGLIIRSAKVLDYINNSIYSLRKKIIFYFFFSLALSLLIGVYVINAIMKPLESVIHASKQYAAGNFGHRILINSSGEIKKLSQTLNEMSENILSKINELNSKNEYLKALFDNMAEAIIVINRKKEEFLGTSIFELFKDTEVAALIEKSLEEKKPVSGEIKSRVLGRYLAVDSVPLFEKGSPAGCITVIRDIDQLKKLELIKKDFFGNASHELKTPLTVIKTNLETIFDGAINDKEHLLYFLKTIEKHSARMENLVKDIISLNYLESESVKIQKAETGLREFADGIYSDLKAAFEKRKIKFSNEIPPDFRIKADRKILEHIFINLLDNAAKFNEENGSVFCRVWKTSGETGISVENTGPGIPSDSLERIFERFYTLDKSRSRDMGGTGLGLAIVKHGAELHGWKIRAESETGKLTKIILALPE